MLAWVKFLVEDSRPTGHSTWKFNNKYTGLYKNKNELFWNYGGSIICYTNSSLQLLSKKVITRYGII